MDPQKTPLNPSNQNNGNNDPTAQSGLPSMPNVQPQGAPELASTVPGQTGEANQAVVDQPNAPKSNDNMATDQLEPKADADAIVPAPVADDIVPDPLPVTAPKSRKKGLIAGLIIAAVLLLLSVGAAASYYYIANKPENVLKQALANSMNMEKAKTSHFSGSVSGEQSGSGTPIETTFKGSADNQTGAIEFSGKVDLLLTNATFDLRSEDSKSIFVRLGGLSGLSELLASSSEQAAAYAPFFNSLNDQWIEINESLIKQYDKSFESGVLTEADAKKFTDAYLKYPFLVVDEVLEDQSIAGESCHHYRIKVDVVKLKGLLTALKDAKLDSYRLDQKALDQLNKAIDDSGLGNYGFEIWISKSGKMIKQLSTSFASGGMDWKVRYTVESYNQPVKVEKPEDAKSLMDIIGEFMISGLGPELMSDAGSDSGISL